MNQDWIWLIVATAPAGHVYVNEMDELLAGELRFLLEGPDLGTAMRKLPEWAQAPGTTVAGMPVLGVQPYRMEAVETTPKGLPGGAIGHLHVWQRQGRTAEALLAVPEGEWDAWQLVRQ